MMRLSRAGRAPDDARVEAIAKGAGLGEPGVIRLRAAVENLLASRAVERAEVLGNVRREAPFAVALGARDGDGRLTPPILQGSIDLLARGDEGEAIVVDYKTGTGGSKKTDEELGARYRLQADCYALAVLESGAATADVVFVLPEVQGPDGRPREVAHAYVAGELPALRADIVSRIAALSAGPYERRATYEPECEHCSAYDSPLCDIRGPVRVRGPEGHR
jgi:RecB family exonuclease